MNEQRLKIINGKIITPRRIIPNGTILVESGKIIAVEEGNIEANGAVVIDAGGKYVSPGFIDIHIHGSAGADFMDGEEEAFLTIAEANTKNGTTAMTPTTLTSEKEGLLHTLDLYDSANKKNTKGAQFLGMHLEGPYFALNQRGAQDPRYIRDPDPAEYKEVIAYSKNIARWSAAPELKGAIEFGQYCCSKGIMPAIAHTDAIYEEVIKAFDNGYTLATHMYSAMSGVTRRNAYRYAGVIESAFLIDEMNVEVIADGKHLPAPLLKLIYKIKGPDRIALITDAIRGAGMKEGDTVVLGNKHTGLQAIIEDSVAKLPDRSSFAGSVATTDRLVRTMVNIAEVPLADAVRMMTATPATIMGVADRKGTLAPGKDADIVVFDGNINVETTIVNGRVVYQKQ
ncbi:MAG: N-acetylglucosamine-6-phosphate deacetylase [Chitinophagaceae bacterium]|nr:N-acetylglucosamine-6-phosphate deacetylase [Chitinophagaceae bacterium]